MTNRSTQLIKIKTARYWKDKNTLFLVNEHGQSLVVGANLIRHVLEVPYTKKDGTFVSKEEIVAMKQKKTKRYSDPQRRFAPSRGW